MYFSNHYGINYDNGDVLTKNMKTLINLEHSNINYNTVYTLQLLKLL